MYIRFAFSYLLPNPLSFIVRKYVEGLQEATQLLDLLAAGGSEEVEPTRAVVGRQALYADVKLLDFISFASLISFFSIFLLLPLWLE